MRSAHNSWRLFVLKHSLGVLLYIPVTPTKIVLPMLSWNSQEVPALDMAEAAFNHIGWQMGMEDKTFFCYPI